MVKHFTGFYKSIYAPHIEDPNGPDTLPFTLDSASAFKPRERFKS